MSRHNSLTSRRTSRRPSFARVAGDEDRRVFRYDLLPSEEVASKFDRERNNSVLAALAVQGDEQIVEVDVRPLQVENSSILAGMQLEIVTTTEIMATTINQRSWNIIISRLL